MEKRSKKTLARTLRWGTACAKLGLIATLFFPAILLARHLWQPELPRQTTRVTQRPQSRELVKIYSIVKSRRPDIRDGEAWKISETILGESSGYGLDPMLVSALIDVESKFQFALVSPAGARGIMQILPDVGQALAEEIGVGRNSGFSAFRPEHLDNPIFNIKLGVYYLYDLTKSFRSLNLALVAYNTGPTEIRNCLENNIGFSEDYANAVLAVYQRFKARQPIF
jgi:soluble lytic murein transglycosylase-like protein